MSLEELRKKIDETDEKIVQLIAERIRISEEIGNEKKRQGSQIRDNERERIVLETVRRLARREKISQEDMENIYLQIITASRSVQEVIVAFQGETGAYSEEAAFQFFSKSIQVKPCEELDGVFKAVEQGETQFGIVPVENSLEGSISRTDDLLLTSDLKIYGETKLRITHCLIAGPGVQLDSIERVYSHPQALGQCQTFLKHLNCETVPTYDTAGSVKMIKEKGITGGAAIASARAAEIYGMQIIARGIEDNPDNFTRFLILARQDSLPSGNDKTSVVFSVRDTPGALSESLKIFASRNINLTRLKSRSIKQKPWEYNFFLDFEGHREDKTIQEALEALDKTTLFLKVLGSYPRAK
jgi:chorismate mutase/prephenate dehydratase